MPESPTSSPNNVRRVVANGHVAKSPTRKVSSSLSANRKRQSNHLQSPEVNGSTDSLQDHMKHPCGDINMATTSVCICGRETKPRLVTQSRGSDWNKRSAITTLNSFIALTLYLILGTVLFSAIELPAEKDELLKMKRNMESKASALTGAIVNETIKQLCELRNITNCGADVNFTALELQMFDLMNVMLDSLEIHEFTADPHSDHVNAHWEYPGAFHFCVTTITTIGYGNFVPLSNCGKVLTVLYCILGIPLFFFVCSQFCKMFSYLFCSVRIKFHVDSSKFKQVVYYICCVLFIQSILFFIPIVVLTVQEDLSPLSAVYFLVITLTTVGYGDLNPLDPVENAKGPTHQVIMNIATWCYMIVGLSLFGNLIRFIQYRIERIANCCCRNYDTVNFKCLRGCNHDNPNNVDNNKSSSRNGVNQSPPVIERDMSTAIEPIPMTPSFITLQGHNSSRSQGQRSSDEMLSQCCQVNTSSNGEDRSSSNDILNSAEFLPSTSRESCH